MKEVRSNLILRKQDQIVEKKQNKMKCILRLHFCDHKTENYQLRAPSSMICPSFLDQNFLFIRQRLSAKRLLYPQTTRQKHAQTTTSKKTQQPKNNKIRSHFVLCKQKLSLQHEKRQEVVFLFIS